MCQESKFKRFRCEASLRAFGFATLQQSKQNFWRCKVGATTVFCFIFFSILDDVRDNILEPINQFTATDLNNTLKLLRKMKVSSFFSKISNQRRVKEGCSPGSQLPCLRTENGKADLKTFFIDVFDKKISGCNERIKARWKSHFSKLVSF